MSTSRSGGPGGQHVNTTESRVSLRWNVATTRALDPEPRARLLAALGPRLTAGGELLVHVSTDRSQHANREHARSRLADIVRAARKPRKSRRPTRPTHGSQLRRLTAKKARGDRLKARGGGRDD